MESKAVQTLNVADEPCSGRLDGSGKLPVLCHKKNRTPVTDDTVIRSKVIHGDGGSVEEYEGGGKRGVVEDTT